MEARECDVDGDYLACVECESLFSGRLVVQEKHYRLCLNSVDQLSQESQDGCSVKHVPEKELFGISRRRRAYSLN